MATPADVTYSVAASAAAIYGGRAAPPLGPQFASVVLESLGSSAPNASPQATVLSLHGSGTVAPSFGATYTGNLPEEQSYKDNTSIFFAVQQVVASGYTFIKPWDRQGTKPSGNRRESAWMGWTDIDDDIDTFRLYTEERIDMILAWVASTYPQMSTTKRVCTGGSMGAWGTMTYGIRRPDKFAALYPSRPRLRYSSAGNINVPDWDNTSVVHAAAGGGPTIDAANGGGTAAAHMDHIAYVGNAANAVPWIGWTVGRNDGYTPFSDHIDMVVALRSTGRGFAFYWNNGNHSDSTIGTMSPILASYPFTLFEVGVGYPVFSNHSLDADPSVDLVGGINVGLTFRNVVESAGAWSCEVTHISSACTVDVLPHSDVFSASVEAQTVTITGANVWASVSFTS